ncbi:MAG: hypothetical protein A2Y38_18765 [Spirochaetes bacterium GWB1_59_5]|nr:MAG: hypothetical protein A2Y38_18765 [Spirochaetes bacterium GWB1_59_5]
MFHPEEVIFAPTGRCNLTCSHCRVSRGPEELSSASAIAFLDSCADTGIERIGFSGGEPFLRLDFLVDVTKAALDRGFYFDRLMTNGDWWKTEAELRSALEAVYGAGFDGVLGLSWDTYHGQQPERITTFLKAVFEVWGRKDAVEILSVRSPDEGAFLRDIESVAAALGGKAETLAGEPSRIVDAVFLTRSNADPDDGKGLIVQVQRFPRSRSAEEGAWEASKWFVDDFCAGPGNVFYVHPDGQVAPCCGFANENQALIIGTIWDSYDTLMANAAANAQVVACYETGLGAVRNRLEAEGRKFPGKTDDICFFCDTLCRRKLL